MPRMTLAVTLVLCIAAPLFAAEAPPIPTTHLLHNGFDVFLKHGETTNSSGSPTSTGLVICTQTDSSGSNVRVDCEGNAPDNETSIAADPTNPMRLIGGGNDYQLITNGGFLYESALSRAMVSEDGGKTWATYAIPYTTYTFTGDPAVAFDATGRAYYATLGFVYGQGFMTGTNADVVVSTSVDGGHNWSTPVKVAAGTGSFGSVGIFNDKEYIAAWGDGNAIVTYSRFNDGLYGSYINSPIYASVTHDGGKSWSAPVEISGSAAFCTGSGAEGAHACDQDQVSVPTVGPDGSIYVAYLNGPASGSPDFDNQYLVVQVDPRTGNRIAGPFLAAVLQDGFDDYPVNVDGIATYQDSQFRTWSAGNITADPSRAGHIAISFSDMRNSPSLDSGSTDPYTTVTNSDVFVAQSFDGGRTWGPVVQVGPAANDQFYPWAVYRADGRLSVAIMDRSYDRKNHAYGITLSTETKAGSLSFKSVQVTNALSDPTSDNRWFSGGVPNHATAFLGDYSGLCFDTNGVGHPLWVDSRQDTCFAGRCGHDQQLWTASTK